MIVLYFWISITNAGHIIFLYYFHYLSHCLANCLLAILLLFLFGLSINLYICLFFLMNENSICFYYKEKICPPLIYINWRVWIQLFGYKCACGVNFIKISFNFDNRFYQNSIKELIHFNLCIMKDTIGLHLLILKLLLHFDQFRKQQGPQGSQNLSSLK